MKESSICTAFIIVAILVSFVAGVMVTKGGWEQLTVEHGCAEYSSQTGDWRWIEGRK